MGACESAQRDSRPGVARRTVLMSVQSVKMNDRPNRMSSPVASRLVLTLLVWTLLDAFVWWAMVGTDHDPRFYRWYIGPLLLRSFLFERSGYWIVPSEIYTLQHGAVAVAVGLLLGRSLSRSSAWQERWDLRAVVVYLVLVVPWGFIADTDRLEGPQFTRNDGLLSVYALCCALAAFGPWSNGARRTLFVVAIGCSVTLVSQIDYFPVTAGPVLLTLVLLGHQVVRGGGREKVFR